MGGSGMLLAEWETGADIWTSGSGLPLAECETDAGVWPVSSDEWLGVRVSSEPGELLWDIRIKQKWRLGTNEKKKKKKKAEGESTDQPGQK